MGNLKHGQYALQLVPTHIYDMESMRCIASLI